MDYRASDDWIDLSTEITYKYKFPCYKCDTTLFVVQKGGDISHIINTVVKECHVDNTYSSLEKNIDGISVNVEIEGNRKCEKKGI